MDVTEVVEPHLDAATGRDPPVGLAEALYGALVPVAILPATDAMLTILPCRCGFMCTITAFVTRTMPLTFTSKIWSQSSQVNSSRSSQPRAPIVP